MARMSKEVMDLFNDPVSVKVLATAGSLLEINVVPKGSLRAMDEETLAFADIFGEKTNRNLGVNPRVSALVFRMKPVEGYQVKGRFEGFKTSGELFDFFAKEIRERLRMEIRGVGIIKVEEVYGVAPPSAGKKIA